MGALLSSLPGSALLAAALLLSPWVGAGDAAPDPAVRFEVRECGGTGATALPVTLSALLAPGVFRDGELCAVVRDGGPGGAPAVVATQVDLLSRHADGSLQHALVTLPLDLAAHATREVWLVPSPAPPLVGPFEPHEGATAAAPPVAVELVTPAGARFTAIVAAPPLELASARGPVDGPLAREFEQVARLAGSDGTLLQLEVRVRWRQLRGVAGARVEVVVENCALLGGADDPPPADIEFARLFVLAGDAVVAELRDGVIWDRTRFAVRRHVGGAAPPRLLVREELAYLIRHGWIPPYDARRPLAPARADALAQRLIDGTQNGTLAAANFELGVPLDSGPIARHMPGTGDRGDIGPIPSWGALALNSRGLLADDVLRAADGNGAAAFPIHVRGRDGVMGVEFGPAKPLAKRSTGRKCPQTPDRAHAPLLGALSFLLTGERFFEEEFAAQAAYCFHDWPHDGRYRYPGSRDFAWSLRTTMLAAQLLPDAHPRKAYFRERVTENLAGLRAMLAESPSPLHAWGSGSFQSSGRKSWPCATQWSPWQASWVAASCEWTARLLGNADARFLYEWQAAYFTRAYAAIGETWRAPDGTVVRWENGHTALAYSFPVATYVPIVERGEWKQRPESRRFIESFAEASWWLRVNLDHEFDGGKAPTLELGPDGVASRPPEQWRPRAGFAPPPVPAASWVVYAMHWFSAVAAADGLPGAAAIDAAVRPLVEAEIDEPGLRMVPIARD